MDPGGRSWRRLGVALGLVLSVAVVAAIYHDRTTRIEAAERRALGVAKGIDRLLFYEIRNLERALRGMASVADGFAAQGGAAGPWDIASEIRGVIGRNSEIQDIDLYARDGTPIRVGVSIDTAPASLPRFEDRDFLVGDLQSGGRGEPVLPLYLLTPEHHVLAARLRTSELSRMLEGADIGTWGSAVILDEGGRILARTGNSHRFTGRVVDVPSLGRGGTAQATLISPLDGVKRRASFTSTSQYPFIVAVGIAEREVLAAWWNYSGAVALFLLVYWTGFFYYTYALERTERARVATQAELLRHADWLSKAQDASHAGVWALDIERELVRATAQAASLFGFAPRDAVIPLEDFFSRMHEDDRHPVQVQLSDALADQRSFRSEYRVVLPTGETRWIEAAGAMVGLNEGGQLMTGTIVDITERREASAQVERAERQFRELFDRNPLPFWVFDGSTLRFLAVNQAAVDRYGFTTEEFLAMSILDIRPEQERADVIDDAMRLNGRGDPGRVWVHRRKDGSTLFVRVYSSDIVFDGRTARLVLAEDVTERVEHERLLAWRATHEESIGLLKLSALTAEVDAWRAQQAAAFAVVYVQLRDLEIVAPTLGRRLGLTLLTDIADRLARIGAAHGPVAYVPSDAFVLVAKDAAQAGILCAAIAHALSLPVEFEGGSYRVDGSLGVAHAATGDPSPAEQVVDHAALAALESRATGQKEVAYSEGMAEIAAHRLAMVEGLRAAIAAGTLDLHLQPIVDIASGKVVAAEALLRWHSPRWGHVSPATFVPLAEESGLIVPLGCWVIEQAARARAQLRAQGHGDIAVAINVSAQQLSAGGVAEWLTRVAGEHGLDGRGFHVEITETAMMRSPEEVRRSLEALRDADVCISVDDFGTGFSSMTYLRELPLDYLKLDRSFVRNVHCDQRNAAICRALIELAHGIGLKVIAEGVEVESEFHWLQQHGCDQAQGYLLGRPAPLDTLMGRLPSA
ncbi:MULTISPECIES: EAL domain-containing protein [unclassified Pseudoxanthomonas]|uniref:bifunctional diguanylate cyclase/phosphodiesterase n=1 Tax=unclassified Pseudoxanthomonas TaxID=2645906 RepID=UPI0008E805B0|nr:MULTISPECIES: EAL domain-containing protein [unclassified Pseudoxanthomonas]SFV30695.1 diguanylate cyclase/phosphodiesterase [Pseudoxanthomonas sp. YR558]